MDLNLSNLNLDYYSKCKKIRILLKQFDSGEKRQWPTFLSELSKIFNTFSFNKNFFDQSTRLLEECKRVFIRVLTTKLFPDIIKEIVICLTSFSTSLEYNCQYLFNWIFEVYYFSLNDDTRLVILKSLAKIIESNHKGINENLSLLLHKTKRIFQEADTNELLMGFTEIFLAASNNNHKIMALHFRNVVDIIISWHINSSHSFAISSTLSRALIDFKTFWIKDINFSTSLLKQFVNNFQICFEEILKDFSVNLDSLSNAPKLNIITDIKKNNDFNYKLENKLEKMASLIKVYLTVLKSVNQFSQPRFQSISWSYMIQTLNQFIDNVNYLIQISLHEPLVICTNDCALYILNLLNQQNQKDYLSELSENLINYINLIHNCQINVNDLYIISTTKLTTKLVDSININLPKEFIRNFLKSDSNFQKLRYMPSKQIFLCYIELIHMFLSLKAIPLLEESYRYVLIDLQENLSILLNKKKNFFEDLSEIDNKPNLKNKKEAEIAVISSLISLTYFSTSKQSILPMWALKPNFFDLVTNHLEPALNTLSPKYSNIQYLVLYILYIHSTNHQNFICTSNIISSSQKNYSDISSSCSLSIVSPSSNHLAKIFKIIIEILKKENLSYNLLILCLDWFKEIVYTSKFYLNSFCKNDLFYQLLDLVLIYSFSKTKIICLKTCEIFEFITKIASQNLKIHTVEECYQVCFFHLTNSENEIRKSYLKLLSLLPIKSTVLQENKFINFLKTNEFYLPNDCKNIKKLIMKREPFFLFNTNCFKIILSKLINTNVLNSDDNQWLKRLLHLHSNYDLNKIVDLNNLNNICKEDTYSNLMDLNNEILYFWSCWELMQYCILNKLRTPLGKPQDTFTKIETIIKQNALQFNQYKENQNCDNYNKQFQIKIILLLMENLDKLIYNAYNGSSLMLFQTPISCKTFFVNNKNTCVEWINRNRLYLMMIALRCADPEIVWRNGEILLSTNFMSKNLSVENVLVILIQAMISLNAYNYIVGIHKWFIKKFKINADWIKGSIEESKGKYETALTYYLDYFEKNYILEKRDEYLKQIVYQFLIRRIIECYLQLGQNTQLLNFYETYEVKDQVGIFSINCDLKYLNSFKTFENDYINHLNWKDYNYENSNSMMCWDNSQIQHQLEKKLIYASNNLINFSHNKQSLEIVKDVYDLSCSVLCFSTQSSIKQNTKFIIIQKISQSILSIYDKENSCLIRNIISCDMEQATKLNCSTLLFCLKWLNILEKLKQKNKIIENDDSNINKLYFITAKSARKQGNLETAKNYLTKYASFVCDFSNNEEKLCLKNLLLFNKNQIFKNDIFNLQYESAKLFFSLNDSKTSIDLILNFISNLYRKLDSLCYEAKLIWSKSVLKLVKYIQLDHNDMNQIFSENANNIFNLIQSVNEPLLTSNANVLKQNDLVVGKLLCLSTSGCPEFAKTWFNLGGWSYRLARKLIDENEKKSENDKLFEYGGGLYCFYKLAAKSYFKFLSLRDNDFEDANVTATLRLLRLIVRHSPILKETLEDGLNNTPINAWKTVILQLFARLGHPQPYVRQIISDLLCRIGKESPHLIVFPSVASSVVNENVKYKLDEKLIELNALYSVENDDDFEKDYKIPKNINDQKMYNNLVSNCHKTLLSNQNPELVFQTTKFIEELKRITLLWNDLWIGTLINNLGEVKKQAHSMVYEVLEISKNPDLNKEQKENLLIERHNLIFKKIIFLFEKNLDITSKQAITPHEIWFQKTFSVLISTVLKLLKFPENPSKPYQTLELYYNLINTFQKKTYQMNFGKSQLAMYTISPILSSLENTIIPMPGANSYNQVDIVTIEKIHKTVVTLHTKTKPKRLAFYGSNGKLYTFLFKGEEDLHLDERIMQILSVINKMFCKSHYNQINKVLYKARNYSVTPIGSKSGLIQWVDGTTLYSIYKRWIKNQNFNNITKDRKISTDKNSAINYRPSEKFNQKLIEKGLKIKFRNLLPLDKLIEVHQELVLETPSDLISKELWCSSTNASEYWELTQNFIHTNAAMCMIGYIIGLGDRHLDNVLVDFNSGELIHIDYNVCFEKGVTLRVPEKVPCRLTNNIVSAFGISKLEGTFRLSCENILKVLRKGRETLLTLLEAFLYDPLFFDWAPKLNDLNYIQSKIDLSVQMKNNSNWLYVWKRVKLKLDGRDPDSSKRSEVVDQVDFILQEATKIENLALMYEGWTSWV